MYIPKHFSNINLDEAKDFIGKNSFGILINQGNNKLCATYIPLELEKNQEGENVLVGHISKDNPQWKYFESDSNVLAIFDGPHSYISSSWYENKNVPTWNYIAVHIYGKIKVLKSKELLLSLKRIVDKYESNSKHPVSVDKMSKETLSQMNGIVGFEIEIEEIQAAYKLSQNRNEKDYRNIIKELESSGDYNSLKIAEEMRKCKK